MIIYYIFYLFKYMSIRRDNKKTNDLIVTNKSTADKEDDLPWITIQLLVYNEKNVVRDLLKSLLILDYPFKKIEIQILDDSSDETSSIISSEITNVSYSKLDIKHIKRGNRHEFKAGALNFGLKINLL